MNLTKYLLLSIFLASSFSIFGQGKDEVQLRSIKISLKQAQALEKRVDTQLYTLDKNGILRPTKGKHIVYHKPSGKVIIKPTKIKTTDVLKPSKQVDFISVMGYTFACDGCGSSCAYGSSSTSGNGTKFHCSGNCDCMEWCFVDPTEEPLEFQTQDGDFGSGWDSL